MGADPSRLWRPLDGAALHRTRRELARRIAGAPADATRPIELRGLLALGHAPRSWALPAFGAVLALRSGGVVVTARDTSGEKRMVGFAHLRTDGRVQLGAALRRWAVVEGRRDGGRELVRELEHRIAHQAAALVGAPATKRRRDA